MPEEYLRRHEAQGFLKVCKETFRKLILAGKISKGIEISPKVRVWRKSELINFVNKCEGLR